jgi:hypothetical protein
MTSTAKILTTLSTENAEQNRRTVASVVETEEKSALATRYLPLATRHLYFATRDSLLFQ